MASVSVIIPAYNASETLSETLESVVAQTRLDWQAIVIDDGSCDETLSLAQAWCQRDPRVQVVGKQNQGPARSRNDGAALATSPWLLFLDADDLIEPNFIEVMLRGASQNSQAEVICCGYVKFVPDGRRDNPCFPPNNSYFENLTRQNMYQPNALLVSRAIFEEVGGFDPSLVGTADWDLWLRIARTGARFVAINEALALYRLRGGQMSSGAETLFKESCRVIDFAHGPDPRVHNPLRGLANGAPRHQRGTVILRAAAWCAGVMIGAGGDPERFFAGLEIDDVKDIKVQWVAAAIAGAVPHGACLLYEDWPLLWKRHSHQVRRAFDHLASFSRRSDFADACWSELTTNLSWLPGWNRVATTKLGSLP